MRLGRQADADAAIGHARAGDRGALARLLSLAEHDDRAAHDAIDRIGEVPIETSIVGVTGAPGAGKSTLTSALVGCARRSGERVAVVAVDPSSPLTSGALLGDRLRMARHSGDDGVFIRSLASRGDAGGLARATGDAVRILAAVGYTTVFVETVGVGQGEARVVEATDTVVVVVSPDAGDEIQANKAGILEVADILVVNKCDLPAAGAMQSDLVQARSHDRAGWTVPVLATTVHDLVTVDDLWSAIAAHRGFLGAAQRLGAKRRQQRAMQVRTAIDRRLRQIVDSAPLDERIDAVIASLERGEMTRSVAVEQVLAGIGDELHPQRDCEGRCTQH